MHDCDSRDEIEWEGEDEFWKGGGKTKGKGVGASLDGLGSGLETAGELAGDEKFGPGAAAEIKDEDEDAESGENAGNEPGKDGVV